MWKFLVDEDMPRSTVKVLHQAGYMAEDVRDISLRGHDDQEIFDYAQAQSVTLVTADKGFSNILRFPIGTHAGIIVVRVPDELPTQQINQELLNALASVAGEVLAGLLIIVEIGRVRIRRP